MLRTTRAVRHRVDSFVVGNVGESGSNVSELGNMASPLPSENVLHWAGTCRAWLWATHSKESETEAETETEPNSRNLLASLLGQKKKRAEPLMVTSERDHEGGSCTLVPWQP